MPTLINYTLDEMTAQVIDHLNYLENIREAIVASSNGIASLAQQQLLASPGSPAHMVAVGGGITIHLNALQRQVPGQTIV